MRFQQFIPCDQLQPYVELLAIQEACEENTYRVLPGTNVVVGFQFKGRLSLIQNEQELALATAGVSALSDRYRIFKSSRNIGTVLVYFKASGASHFFRQPLHELFRESVSLENLWLRSELLITEDRLYSAKTDEQRILIVENFLVSQLLPSKADTLVETAVTLIHQAKGNIRITDLANALNISQSPLEKRFRHSVGTTAKKFASIVRMKYILDNTRLPEIDLVYTLGFYDQAHFIKQFKSFTGETPSSYNKRPGK